jgi:hypothetical protein
MKAYINDAKLSDFRVGQRVELHPATDLWMRGARFGDIVKIGRKLLTVKLDALRRPIKISPSNIYAIVE